MKKIYTILVLLFNVIIRRKHYTLSFKAEHDSVIKRWYYVFPHWGFSHDNLEMVSGTDKLCEMYSNGSDELTVEIVASRKKLANRFNYECFVSDTSGLKQLNWIDKKIYGRNYIEDITAFKKSGSHIKPRTFWICPVTLFVLGRYPKYLYIKKI